MRWNEQEKVAGLFGVKGLVRSVRTPEFAGMTFHEVLAKSALNRVPKSSGMPFSWTINPYRGCSHACVYCFARSTHRYLDLDSGEDFDREVIVKVNTPEVLAAEVAKPKWSREHLDAALRAISEAGAHRVVYGALHLRPGAREWFFEWLGREHPELLPRYRRMYANSPYASKEYRTWLRARIDPLIDRYGLRGSRDEDYGERGALGTRGDRSATGTSSIAIGAEGLPQLQAALF